MTSEDAFQAILDERPDDSQLRLVFADWLQDHADPRADGYRALGELAIWPITSHVGQQHPFAWFAAASQHPLAHNALPDSWFLAVSELPAVTSIDDLWPRTGSDAHARCPSRRQLEDTVARAWLAVDETDRMKIRAGFDSPRRGSSNG